MMVYNFEHTKRSVSVFRFFVSVLIATFLSFPLVAQVDSVELLNNQADSLYIAEVEEVVGKKHKNLHAEPLFIDLIRDLGARKGEKEWNIGLGITDQTVYDSYTALLEYEFAPLDRVGFEIETPFSFYYPTNGDRTAPGSKLNSLKLASQYTFLVSDKTNTSAALGYIHEFELADFREYGKSPLLTGHLFNPFFVSAKRWGNHFHTLLYTGPRWEMAGGKYTWKGWEYNKNVHYMIPGTRNFVGLEVNSLQKNRKIETVLRPQMRVGLAHNLFMGIVTGVPISRKNERFSSFVRIIWEPGSTYRH
jgi:hypothetical protein